MVGFVRSRREASIQALFVERSRCSRNAASARLSVIWIVDVTCTTARINYATGVSYFSRGMTERCGSRT